MIYLLWFHPLAKFPGPIWAKLTNGYAAYHSWKGDLHLNMYECHQRYGKHVLFFVRAPKALHKLIDEWLGDYIRYGPNRLLFNTSTALNSEYLRSTSISYSRPEQLTHGS